MTQNQQQDAFINDLHRLIDRFADEYELTHASLLGAIEIVKWEILTNLDMQIEMEGGDE